MPLPKGTLTGAPDQSRSWAGLGSRGAEQIVAATRTAVSAARLHSHYHVPRGNLRSYSGIALCAGGLAVDLRRMDRWLEADWSTGVVRVEAGLTLKSLCDLSIANGWFPIVVPGTGQITVGGAIASDVHGKNHVSAGSFGTSVLELTIERSDLSAPTTVRPGDPLFDATIGGLGLTGIVTEVVLQLGRVASAAMEVVRRGFRGLCGYRAIEAETEAWEHRVAWLDLTTKGEIRGEHCCARWAAQSAAPPAPVFRQVLIAPPLSLVTMPVRRLGSFVLGRGRRRSSAIEHYQQFLHPLDALAGWNKLWGPSGFRQYQCVIQPGREDVLEAILATIQRSGLASPLVVLKRFGPKPARGLLSFPREGYTLAVDFPNSVQVLEGLFPALDRLVAGAGGALYPAKDARIPRDIFERSFPRLEEFKALRDRAIQSDFSRRYDL